MGLRFLKEKIDKSSNPITEIKEDWLQQKVKNTKSTESVEGEISILSNSRCSDKFVINLLWITAVNEMELKT